jgi:hypothetical protein
MPDGHSLQPDIVIASASERAVLVIDVKYATPPNSAADIDQDLKEMDKWKARMAQYVSGFSDHADALRQHLQWTATSEIAVFGLILPRWPLPIPATFAGRVGAVDWPSFKEHIECSRPSSIHEVAAWAGDRPDLRVPALVWLAKDIHVGEWTYRYSVPASIPVEHMFDATQKLAYRLWERRGRPFEDDLRDWFDAEQRLATDPYASLNL